MLDTIILCETRMHVLNLKLRSRRWVGSTVVQYALISVSQFENEESGPFFPDVGSRVLHVPRAHGGVGRGGGYVVVSFAVEF